MKRFHGYSFTGALVVLVAIVSGCAATQGEKSLPPLVQDAADAGLQDVASLHSHVQDQAGLTLLEVLARRLRAIKASGIVLEHTVGKPEIRPVYSLAEHERWNVVAVDEQQRNENMLAAAFNAIDTGIKAVAIGVPALAFLGTVWGYVKKARQAAASASLLELKDKVLGAMVRGVQKAETYGTSAASEIAKEADVSGVKHEVHTEVLEKRAPAVAVVIPPPPAPDPPAAAATEEPPTPPAPAPAPPEPATAPA